MNLIDKIARAAKLPAPAPLTSANLDCLERVRSVRECIEFFESQLWVDGAGLSGELVSKLAQCCDGMRRRGLGLEPNLIGRAAIQCIASPSRIGEASVLFSRQDGDFVALVSEADVKRDSGDYGGAQYDYYRALMLYYGHPAILVQYSHMLKEGGAYQDALVHYLDAVLFGAPLHDVEEHALFVANVLGLKAEVAARFADPGAAVTSFALRVVCRLLLGRDAHIGMVLDLMLNSNSISDAFVDIITSGDFKNSNRDLLRVVAETGWGPQVA